MTKSKYDWQLKYRRLITEKPYMMFFLGLVFTIIFGMEIIIRVLEHILGLEPIPMAVIPQLL